MNPIEQLHLLGQSIWYDNIERRLLTNGEMAAMIAQGQIRGITSNPSIFNQAIAKSRDYDEALVPLAKSGASQMDIYEKLAVEDIRAACDLFLPLYEVTQGGDGYVSLEVSPYLAHDTTATAVDAARFWAWVDRPNLMIKIPATIAGLPAVTRAIADGINVNVTLIFSLHRYEAVMDAYLTGLEQRLAAGKALARIASVASFFVSRIDTHIDPLLQAIIAEGGETAVRAQALLGKSAIANARLAYQRFKQVFSGERWQRLQAAGARPQRPLWASTSTKNPNYRDTMYVENLIGDDTVNTVPPATLEAFRKHGVAAATLETGLDAARFVMDELADLSISMDAVTQTLEEQGVKAFADAFTALLSAIEDRRERITQIR